VVDQGSTATKGALVSEGGEREAASEVAVARRAAGSVVSHDPEEVASTVEALLADLLAARPVSAIGLACQRSTCLLWERETGRALTEARSWQDTSQGASVERLADDAGEVARRTGLRLSPHYAAPKLAALIDSLPDGRRRAERGEIVAGTLDAFLVRRLTGRDATEPGCAGRTLLYNLADGAWDPWLCDLFGIPAAALPALATSAGAWGEHRGVPLAAVAGDQQAALVGHGGWRGGRAAAHFGTGAFVLAATGEAPRFHPGLLTAVLASTPREIRYQIEGPVNSAGSAVDWICRLTGREVESFDDRPLDGDALDPAGSKPWVLPAFTGAAAPWWRPRARGAVAGLTLDHGAQELFDAVLSGVAMRVLDGVEAMREAGIEIRSLRVSGKLMRRRALVGLLADAGALEVEVGAEEEAGLAGVLALAALVIPGWPDLLPRGTSIARRRRPRWSGERAARMRTRWRAFVERELDSA